MDVRELALVDTRVPFIGRALELERVLDAIRRGQVLTLVGAGGVGKSRLAYEAALRFERESQNRTVFVRLAGIVPESVNGAVMHALGIQDELGRPPIATFRELLAETPITLVLDSCEHAPDETSALIDALATVPNIAILATSQRRLDYTDETVFEIAPFSRDDAVAFFVARANLEASPDAETLAVISQIVDRLDGLAVAIDLAAARLASLSLPMLAEQLADLRPYQLRSTRGSEPRHRTIGNVIAWSYAQLDDQGKRVFAIASLFADVFDHQDICALVGVDEATARALLDELAERSLIVRAEFGARMLTPIRAVAARILATMSNRKVVEEAFARRIDAVAAEIWRDLNSDEAGATMQRLFVRYADFCAVMAWALKRPQDRIAQINDVTTASMVLWADGGRFTEGLRWTERLESVAERLPPQVRGRIYYLGLVVSHAASDYRRIIESGPKIISAFTIANDRLGLARAYNALAAASLNSGNGDDAATYVETALRLYQQLGHQRGIATALINKGSVHFEHDNDVTRARVAFQTAAEMLVPLGASALAGIALGNLAEVEYSVCEYDRSDELARDAIDHFEATSGLPMIAWQYQTMARSALARGRYPIASDCLQTACRLLRRSPQALYLARLAEVGADALLAAGFDVDAAFASALAERLRRERSLPTQGLVAREVAATNRALSERLSERSRSSATLRAAGAELSSLASTLSSLLRAVEDPERDRSDHASAKT